MKTRNVVIAVLAVIILLVCATMASIDGRRQDEQLPTPIYYCTDKNGNVIAAYGFDICSRRVYSFS